MNNKSAVSFHPQDKSSGSHSTLLIDKAYPAMLLAKGKIMRDAVDFYEFVENYEKHTFFKRLMEGETYCPTVTQSRDSKGRWKR